MIELAIAMAMATYVVRHSAELVAAITGKETTWQKAQAHRIEARTKTRAARAARAGEKAPRKRSAFWDYLALLWEDGWTDAKSKHSVNRSRRLARQAEEPSRSGSMRGFLRQIARDGWSRWDWKWDAATKRRAAKTRPFEPSPDSPVVPGITVPVPDDLSGLRFARPAEDGTKPQSGPQTAEPTSPPATKPPCSNCNPIHLHDDQCAIKTGICPKCHQEGVIDHGACPTCWEIQQYGHVDEDGQHLAWHVTYPNGQTAITDDPRMYRRKGYPVRAVRGYDREHGFLVTDNPTARSTQPATTATPTTEGTTMSTPNAEVTGLDSSVQFCKDAKNNADITNVAVEQLTAFLETSKVNGAVFGYLAQAREHYDAISNLLQSAENELSKGYGVRDAYEAAQGAAGDKQYVESH